jgi:hypothetical protein
VFSIASKLVVPHPLVIISQPVVGKVLGLVGNGVESTLQRPYREQNPMAGLALSSPRARTIRVPGPNTSSLPISLDLQTHLKHKFGLSRT